MTATTDERPASVAPDHREQMRQRIETVLRGVAIQGRELDPADLADRAFAAVLEEAGWQLRQEMTKLRGRIEIAQARVDQGQEALSAEEIEELITTLDRTSNILDLSLDRNETAKHLIPIQPEAFDLAERLGDWLEAERLFGPGSDVRFPMDPSPVKGDPVKLPKAIGSLVEWFNEQRQDGQTVVGKLAWNGPWIEGYVGLVPNHMAPASLLETLTDPVHVGDLRFDLALVRAVVERHEGRLSVHRIGEDGAGLAFRLPALASGVEA